MGPNEAPQQPSPEPQPEQPATNPMPPSEPEPAPSPEEQPVPTVPHTPVPEPGPPTTQEQPAQQASLPPVPESWPGAFGVYKYSKRAVKFNLANIILFGLLGIVLGGGVEVVLKRPGQLVSLIIGSLFSVILTYLYIAGVREQKVSANDAFSKGLKLWLKMIGLSLLVDITVIISALLLVIPVFFVGPRLALVNYFLVDKDMGVIEAYKASWHATKGSLLKVYGVIGVSILMALLLITIIGIPFSIYFLIMYSAAFAVLYELVLRQSPPQPVTEPPVRAASPAS